jgi:hypothetical protein
MGVMRYRKRVGFLAGLTVAQISEFSLIFAALGVSLGHIGGTTLGLITTVGVVTIALSTYLILNSHWLFERLEPWLGIFEREAPKDPSLGPEGPRPEVIVIGLGRYGGEIVRSLADGGVRALGVDFDPEALERVRSMGVPVIYGDADDPDLAEVLPLEEARWIVSSVRTTDVNLGLIQALRSHGYGGRIAVSTDRAGDAALLRDNGADRVLVPLRDAADDATRALEL